MKKKINQIYKKARTNKLVTTSFWIVFGLLILGGIAIANTVISDSPSSYFSGDNVTINETGVHYSTTSDSQKLTKTADVVVCRGTSALDDLIKSFTCDVVCKHNDDDCSDELDSSLTSNSVVIWRGVFPIPSTGTGVKMGLSNFENVILYADGAILNISSVDANSQTFVQISSVNNFRIIGLEILGNKTCGAANNCIGLEVKNNNNIYLENIKITGVKGFQIFVNTNNNQNNIYIYDSYFEGYGVADVIGGGVSSSVANATNIIIHDNFVNQSNESETKGTTNSKITDNIVISHNETLVSNIGISNYESFNNIIDGNLVDGGVILNNGNYSRITNNFVNHYGIQSNSGISSNGKGNIISSNTIIGGGKNGIYIQGDYNLVSNNWIENLTERRSVNPIGIVIESTSDNNKINDNVIVNPSSNTIQNGIYLATATNNIIENNVFYNNGAVTANWIHATANSKNNTIKDNKIYGNVTGFTVYNDLGDDNYFDVTAVSGDISSTLTCADNSPRNGEIESNSTTSCICLNSNWKCWSIS